MTAHKLTAAQRRLVEDNLLLVGYTLDRYYRGSIPRDEEEDFAQIGCVELCKAASCYTPGSGAFSTYAVPAIRRGIAREYQHRYRAKRRHGTMVTLDEYTEDDRPLEESIPDGAPSVELLASLHVAMDRLPEKDRLVMRSSIDGLKHREIAAIMHCTGENVRLNLKRIRRQLADQLATS